VISKRYDDDGSEIDSLEIDRLLNVAACYRNDRDAAGHITIIFAAMCLEAIINHYAIALSSKKYLVNYLDKLDLKSKWIIIPKLLSNIDFNRDSQAFEVLDAVLTLRNDLVHYKSRVVKYTFEEKDNISIEEDKLVSGVKNSIKAMICVIEELHRIDPKWKEYKWYLQSQKDSPDLISFIK